MFGLFKKKESVNEAPAVFFSILLSENLVQAALWTIDNGLVYIKNKSTLRPYFNEADCLVKLDECLQELGAEGEAVAQTIFHLDHSFADDHGIFAEKKDFFKNLLSSLQLTSIGFVANVEAVVGSKMEEEENVTHHLIIEFTKKTTLFSLFEGKVLLESYLAENTSDLATQFAPAREKFIDVVDIAKLEMLGVTLISALLSTEELTTKESSFPADLPLKFSYIGSDIILPVVAVPGATAIAKAKGWLTPPLAADEVVAPVATAAVVGGATASVAAATAAVNNSINDDEEFVPKRRAPKKTLPVKPFIIAGIIVGILVVAAVLISMFLNQTVATIVVQPKTQVLSKNIEITIDPEAEQSDYEKLILVGTLSSETLTDQVTVPATGKKAVGEKATGKVMLVNKKCTEVDKKCTEEPKKFSSGTTLTADKVSFTLTEDVTVDPPTVTTDSEGKVTGTKYSEKEASVEANEIGTSGNIKNDTKLQIAAYSSDSFEAVAKGDFSGGSSEDVTVVAAADVTKATKEATETLRTQAQQLDKKETGKYYTPVVNDLKITSQEPSVEVGEEAKELTLDVTATIPLIAYDAQDLKPLATAVLEKELPAGYTMTGEPELMSAVDEDAENEDETLTLQADLTSLATAQVDLEQLRASLIGQELVKADNILKSDEAIKAYEIKWSNDWYGKIFGKLPTKADKLEVSFYNTSP